MTPTSTSRSSTPRVSVPPPVRGSFTEGGANRPTRESPNRLEPLRCLGSHTPPGTGSGDEGRGRWTSEKDSKRGPKRSYTSESHRSVWVPPSESQGAPSRLLQDRPLFPPVYTLRLLSTCGRVPVADRDTGGTLGRRTQRRVTQVVPALTRLGTRPGIHPS